MTTPNALAALRYADSLQHQIGPSAMSTRAVTIDGHDAETIAYLLERLAMLENKNCQIHQPAAAQKSGNFWEWFWMAIGLIGMGTSFATYLAYSPAIN